MSNVTIGKDILKDSKPTGQYSNLEMKGRQLGLAFRAHGTYQHQVIVEIFAKGLDVAKKAVQIKFEGAPSHSKDFRQVPITGWRFVPQGKRNQVGDHPNIPWQTSQINKDAGFYFCQTALESWTTFTIRAKFSFHSNRKWQPCTFRGTFPSVIYAKQDAFPPRGQINAITIMYEDDGNDSGTDDRDAYLVVSCFPGISQKRKGPENRGNLAWHGWDVAASDNKKLINNLEKHFMDPVEDGKYRIDGTEYK